MPITLTFDHMPAGPLGIAVSGGSDSLALLHAAHQNFDAQQLQAITINHGLRAGAGAEVDFVKDICAKICVPHFAITLDDLQNGPNLQARARSARYAALAQWAKGQGVHHIAVGHSATDVAETFLLRLARGSGVDGLAGMAPQFTRDGITFHRPLLHHSRADLQSFLQDMGLSWCDDPSNDDPAFDRVKMRQALPILAQLGLDAEKLAQTAGRLAAARDVLTGVTMQAVAQICSQKGNAIVLDIAQLQNQPQDIAQRLSGWILQWVGRSAYPPRAQAVARFASASHDATLNGCQWVQKAGKLWVGREYAAVNAQPAAQGDDLWDMNWALGADAPQGSTVQALGTAGYSQIKQGYLGQVPRKIVLAAPAIWQGDVVIACPMLEYGPEKMLKKQQSFEEFVLRR